MSVATSTVRAPAVSWPPAPIAHPGWRAVRAAILDRATKGPATIAVLGSAGTGKTLLLRDIAATLRQCGADAEFVRQGDLPFDPEPDAAVLVDEASRMDAATLARLSAQRTGLVVVADLPAFLERLDRLPHPPEILWLKPLAPDQLPSFVAEWLADSAYPATTLTADVLRRLAERSGCVPRRVTGLLGAATATARAAGRTSITTADVDDAANARIDGLATEADPVAPITPGTVAFSLAEPSTLAPASIAIHAPIRCDDLIVNWRVPPAPTLPTPPPLPSRNGVRPALALAASVVMLLASPATSDRRESAPVPRAVVAALPAPLSIPAAAPATVTAPLPAILPIVSAAGSVAPDAPDAPVLPQADASTPPEIASSPSVPLADGVLPTVTATVSLPAEPAPAAQPISEPNPAPAFAVLASPPRATLSEAAPQAADASPPSPLDARVGGPGLVLVARAGDTLRSLYGRVYGGVTPAAYAEVVAANPHPLRPGGIVVFPTPPNGWTRP